jgi:pyrroloquinoline quinone biosynthesis protein D
MSPIDEQSHPALASGVRLQNDAISGEPVLVFPEGVLFLSATAREIVGKCDGTASVARIISELADDYEAADGEMRADVLECLTQLHQRNLLTLRKPA